MFLIEFSHRNHYADKIGSSKCTLYRQPWSKEEHWLPFLVCFMQKRLIFKSTLIFKKILWKNWESSNFFTLDVRRVKVDTKGNSMCRRLIWRFCERLTIDFCGCKVLPNTSTCIVIHNGNPRRWNRHWRQDCKGEFLFPQHVQLLQFSLATHGQLWPIRSFFIREWNNCFHEIVEGSKSVMFFKSRKFILKNIFYRWQRPFGFGRNCTANFPPHTETLKMHGGPNIIGRSFPRWLISEVLFGQWSSQITASRPAWE